MINSILHKISMVDTYCGNYNNVLHYQQVRFDMKGVEFSYRKALGIKIYKQSLSL